MFPHLYGAGPVPGGMFPDVFTEYDYGDGAPPKTLVELTMIQMSAAVRNKPNWETKMRDPEIVAKWRKEASDASAAGQTDVPVTPKMLDYVFEELKEYAKFKQEHGGKIEHAAVDGTFQADGLVSDELRQRLIAGVARLEDVPEHLKDWHPGSDRQVLDLVHPSLFCLVYGRTRHTTEPIVEALGSVGGGEIIPSPPPPKYRDFNTSTQCQWLPSEFHVAKDGRVTIESYINNLHPVEHAELYPVLASVFEEFVPLFNLTLTAMLKEEDKSHLRVQPGDWYRPRERRQRPTTSPATAPAPGDGDGNDDDDDEDSWEDEHDDEDDEDDDDEFDPESYFGIFTMPEPAKYQPPNADDAFPPFDLRGTTLQVIVKLANICLTPENPTYQGGSWHVEGMRNEKIVASGIYYYQQENITESNLDFRQSVGEPDYEQNDNNGVRRVYGLEDGGELNQPLGGIATKDNRCIAFPNTMQHRVRSFQLLDPTKPGSRKILVFFLVDPHERIPSTKHIPPQQRSWYMQEVSSAPIFPPTIPPELVDEILDRADWPMGLEEAKQHRETLMKERKRFVTANNDAVFAREFSLCEH
ncbi:hypothetical protein CAOG_006699 [Capsaspora owczarzaki ATCC 30864]|uniref:Uncharacterized protein n=2 Tax=Capsaspora owczarzaki (strain ATCC 30864) TaxID=595528 RepID=A0A0D2UMU4_CAPO3|nr:hypothetical protein CAOG_006699 [Capsaspora owczarzaki ATCC 30864]